MLQLHKESSKDVYSRPFSSTYLWITLHERAGLKSKCEGAGLKIQQKPLRERNIPACTTKNVTDVFFADDGSLISCKDPDNCELVRAMKDSLESMGLKVNTKKTKYMRVQPRDEDEQNNDTKGHTTNSAATDEFEKVKS
eukprot:Selendium_serpulae@DN4742_c1_g2_i2.p1